MYVYYQQNIYICGTFIRNVGVALHTIDLLYGSCIIAFEMALCTKRLQENHSTDLTHKVPTTKRVKHLTAVRIINSL